MRRITTGPFTGLPEHNARVLLADPPWKFKTFSADPGDRAPDYKTMTIEEIMALPVNELCWKDCWLFLWTSGPFLDFARQAMKAWGFKYSTIAFTWVKLREHINLNDAPANLSVTRPGLFHRGLGKTTRKNTELCLLGRLGSPPITQGGADELIVSAVREHSRKPDETHDRIEALAGGPYVELFARQSRPGWTTWGNQRDKFDT